jgi:hypothetical protein
MLLCLVPVAGCSKPPPPAPVPVKGKVVFADGKPVKGVVLSFHPDDEATKSGRLPSAPLDDGSFSFECLPGRYKVTLTLIPKGPGGTGADGPGSVPPPPPQSGPPKDPKAPLLAPYASPTSTPLTIEVPPGGSSDLVLTVK